MVRRIGRYEITRKLGDGGFGSVYQGFDPVGQRQIAIKVLSAGGDAGLIGRFRSEAAITGNLHHKNIVTIYEFGEDAGTPFLAMEYLDGVDLQQIINNKSERESLTLLEKMEIMSEAAQGLQCAHENGVVHRDVKPANIMCLKDGSVKIMDFGIARLTNAASTRLTHTGLMIGTVPYMAPEQFRPGEVDALCDIWSYGVVFHELLTGVHPFRADGPAECMYRITMEEPPLVTSLVPSCPPALAANIQRLLSKDRQSRTQSLDDFLLDVEPVIASLAKVEIPELLKRAERLIDEDNIDTAQRVIGRLSKLDRANKEVRQLRSRLRERVRFQAIRPKIELLLREAEERAGSRDFKAAVEKLNSAILLDPNSPTLRSRLERVRGEEERAKRADEAISRGRRSLNEGDLTGAFARFSEALESDPGNSQGPALLEEVKHAMRDREIRAQVRTVMAEANNLILIEAYDDAIALLADLSNKTNSDDQVVRRLQEARQLKQAQEIKDRLNAAINASRELLKRGSYEQACRALEELDRENPNNPAIEVLLTHARERLRAEKLANEIENLLGQARGRRNSGLFDEALQFVKRALVLDPANARAMALQRTYLDEAQADRDRRKIDSGLEQYQALLKQEKLEEALELVDRLATDHPGEARVAAAKADIEDRIGKREEARRRKIQEGIHEAERLLEDARPASATRLLANLTVEYPAEASVRDLLDRAQRLKVSQEAQDRLNAGLNSARELLKSGNYEQACRVLEALDKENSQNPAIEVLLTHARERLKEEQIAARIERLLGEAQGQQVRGRFEAALQLVRQALELDPENGRALAVNKTLLEQCQADRDRAKIAVELEKLQVLLREQKFDEALAAVEQLATLFPLDARVLEAKKDIAKRIRERDDQRTREMSSGANEAERMLADGRAASATRLLGDLISQFPAEPSLRGLLERAHEHERENALRDEIRMNIEAAREFVSRRDWDRALALIGSVLKQRPECHEYVQEAETIQRLKECDEELSAVEAALKSGLLEQAVSMAEKAVAKFPGDPRARAALQTARNRREFNELVATQQKEHERLKAYDRGRTEAENHLRNLRFGNAIDTLQRLLLDFPDDSTLRDDIDNACAARDHHAAREKYKRGRAESRKLSEQGDLAEAIEILQRLLDEFPADPSIIEDLQSIQGAKRLREERIRIDALISQLEALFRAGEAEAVMRGAKKILSQHKEPRASELLDWAERSIAQTREIRETTRKPRPFLLWGVIGGLVAVVIVLGRGYFFPPPPPPPQQEFKVQPAEFVFSYQKGGQLPNSQPLRIEAVSPAQNWRIADADRWIQISKAAGKGTSDLDVKVDPSGLAPGEYASVAKVSSDSQPKTIRIRLVVTEPEKKGDRATTVTTLTSSSNPSTYSESVTLRGTLSPSAATGTVTFREGPAILGTGTLAGGTATITLTALSAGSHYITASYGGNSNYSSSTSALTQKVTILGTKTTLTSMPNPSTSGQIVTLTATNSQRTATGTVTFYDGTSILGSASLMAGTATTATAIVSVGSHSLTAVYGGDGNHSGSMDGSMHTVQPAVDCFNVNFGGLHKDDLTWAGEQLAPGALLTITGRKANPEGNVRGPLPGCPVDVTSQTDGVVIQSEPGLKDGFRQIVLMNKSDQPIRSIRVHWEVKKKP